MLKRFRRRCACPLCFGAGTWLDYARTMERFASGKHHDAAYICTRHCRKEYPHLFPAQPRQIRLPRIARYRARKGISFPYVPLDSPVTR